MTIHPLALCKQATTITTVAVLTVGATLLAAATPSRAAIGRPKPVLSEGAGVGAKPSAQVRAVQRALQRLGYNLGPPGVDGRFGPLTEAAVRRMQVDHGLKVDGVVGPDTREALRPARRAVVLPASTPRLGQAGSLTRHAPGGPAVTSAHDGSAAASHRGVSWFGSFLAGVIGGLIAALSAITVARRLRAGEPAARSAPRQPFAETADRTRDEVSRNVTAQHSNGNGAVPTAAIGAAVQRAPSGLLPGHRVIGYVTVPEEPGLGAEDGMAAEIKAMCERSGWELLEIVRDREVGPTLGRPALGYALKQIADGQAHGLVVANLQRLSRSIVDLGALMTWFRKAQAALIALDLDIDTSTPKGQRVATALIALSTQERERIAHRNGNGRTDGPADRRAGRPAVSHDPALLARIAEMRRANMTFQAIADRLNAEGVPTLRGGSTWRPSSIQAALGYHRPAPRDRLPSLQDRKVVT